MKRIKLAARNGQAWIRLRYFKRVNRWHEFGAQHGVFAQWVLLYGPLMAVAWVALFVATGLAGGAIADGSFGVALEIALGTKGPFASRADVAGVPLAVLSMLLMPALVGAIVAIVIAEQLRRLRPFDPVESHTEDSHLAGESHEPPP